jgi:outer membrane protein assembly factor BamB
MILFALNALANPVALEGDRIVATVSRERLVFRAADGLLVERGPAEETPPRVYSQGPLRVRDGCTIELEGSYDTAWSADERWLAAWSGRSVLLVDAAACAPIGSATVERGVHGAALTGDRLALVTLASSSSPALELRALPSLDRLSSAGLLSDVVEGAHGAALVLGELQVEPPDGSLGPASAATSAATVVETPLGLHVVRGGHLLGAPVPVHVDRWAVSDDGRVLVTLDDQELVTWSVADGRRLWAVTVPRPRRSFSAVRVGRAWVAAIGSPTWILDPRDGRLLASIPLDLPPLAGLPLLAGAMWTAPAPDTGEVWVDREAGLLGLAPDRVSARTCVDPAAWLRDADAVPGLGASARAVLAEVCAKEVAKPFPATAIPAASPASWTWTPEGRVAALRAVDGAVLVATADRYGILGPDGALRWSRVARQQDYDAGAAHVLVHGPFDDRVEVRAAKDGSLAWAATAEEVGPVVGGRVALRASRADRWRVRDLATGEEVIVDHDEALRLGAVERALGWACAEGRCVRGWKEAPQPSRLVKRGRSWWDGTTDLGVATLATADAATVWLSDGNAVTALRAAPPATRADPVQEEAAEVLVTRPRALAPGEAGPPADLVLFGARALAALDARTGATLWTARRPGGDFDPLEVAFGRWRLTRQGLRDDAAALVDQVWGDGEGMLSVRTFADQKPSEWARVPGGAVRFGAMFLAVLPDGVHAWDASGAERWVRPDLAGATLEARDGWPVAKAAAWTVLDPRDGRTVASGRSELSRLSRPGGPLRVAVRRPDRRLDILDASGEVVGRVGEELADLVAAPGGAIFKLEHHYDAGRDAVVGVDARGERWRRRGAYKASLFAVGDTVLLSTQRMVLALEPTNGDVRWASMEPGFLYGAVVPR